MGGRKPKRCLSSSGFLFGFRCELERGHKGQHQAMTNEVYSERFGKRELVARTVRSWDG